MELFPNEENEPGLISARKSPSRAQDFFFKCKGPFDNCVTLGGFCFLPSFSLFLFLSLFQVYVSLIQIRSNLAHASNLFKPRRVVGKRTLTKFKIYPQLLTCIFAEGLGAAANRNLLKLRGAGTFCFKAFQINRLADT